MRPTRTCSAPVGGFELSEHLPHLFKQIHSQLQAASAEHLAEFGVNVAVWRILSVLWEHGDLSHRDLSNLTSIEVSTLSRLSKRAQRNGLIRRPRTPENQRSVRVTLTEKGRNLTRSIIPSALNCQADTVGHLSTEDVEMVTRLLQVIVRNLSGYANINADTDAADTLQQPTRQISSFQNAGIFEIEPGVSSHELLRNTVAEIE